jgi:hypothetical protein
MTYSFEEPNEFLLRREESRAHAEQHFLAALSALRDMVGYGTHLIIRACNASAKDHVPMVVVAVLLTMIDRVEQRFDLKPDRLIGDTAYGTGPLLAWLVQDKQIEPHIPVWDKADRRDGTLSRREFNFDADQDRYTCPAGKPLPTTGRPTADGVKLYRASVSDCQACSLKPKCCPNTPARKIPRSIHEASRDAARELVNTDVYRQSRKDRKKVEILFAHLKRVLRLGRLRLRGRTGARDEFLLAATAQNLRRMARWLIPRMPQADLAPS